MNGNVSANVSTIHGVRVLCIAEIRGKLSLLNKLAEENQADLIIHTGNFGFFDDDSINKIPGRTLRHISVFSAWPDTKKLALENDDLKKHLGKIALSELPKYIAGTEKINVPVYTVYGASEDLSVLEKFHNGTYKVPNLHIIDENSTFAIETPDGPKIRLFGIGGALVLHRFFDNGDGVSSVAGTHGLMWSTALQFGQLIQTAKAVFDPSDIRIFVTHPSPSREGLLTLIALTLRADFTISSGLHLLYSSSFSEFATSPSFESFQSKLLAARKQFNELWDVVRPQISRLVEDNSVQKSLLDEVIAVFDKLESPPNIDGNWHDKRHNDRRSNGKTSAFTEYIQSAYRTLWHFNICDVDYGTLVLNINKGRVSAETKSQGFDFNYREQQEKRRIARAERAEISKTEKARTFDLRQQQQQQQKSSENARSDEEDKTDGSNETRTEREPREPRELREPREPPKAGVWIPSCGDDEEEVRQVFAEEDREFITSIAIKESYKSEEREREREKRSENTSESGEAAGEPAEAELQQQDSENPEKVEEKAEEKAEEPSTTTPVSKRKFALVYFADNERAQAALERLDQEKAGGHASLIGSRPRSGRGGFFRGRGPRARPRGGRSYRP